MRVLRIGSIAAALVLLLAVVVVEVALPSIATRTAREAVERCYQVDHLEVTDLGRPAVFGLVAGTMRDVELEVTGLDLGDLRIAAIQAQIPKVGIREGAGPDVVTIELEARLEQTDLQRYLDAVAPDLASPTLAVTPQGVKIGDARLPATLDLVVTIERDVLTLTPRAGDPRLWTALGLELTLAVPEQLTLGELDLARGRMVLSGQLDLPTDDAGRNVPWLGDDDVAADRCPSL